MAKHPSPPNTLPLGLIESSNCPGLIFPGIQKLSQLPSWLPDKGAARQWNKQHLETTKLAEAAYSVETGSQMADLYDSATKASPLYPQRALAITIGGLQNPNLLVTPNGTIGALITMRSTKEMVLLVEMQIPWAPYILELTIHKLNKDFDYLKSGVTHLERWYAILGNYVWWNEDNIQVIGEAVSPILLDTFLKNLKVPEEVRALGALLRL